MLCVSETWTVEGDDVMRLEYVKESMVSWICNVHVIDMRN